MHSDNSRTLINIDYQMHGSLFRQPIHLHIANRGKLRKVQHQRLEPIQQQQELLLTPNIVLSDNKVQRKNYHQVYFKKQEERSKILSNPNQPVLKEHATGSFRAIHTADPQKSFRGFPLRSITAIKPFRRGIRSTHKSNNTTVFLDTVKEDPGSRIRKTVAPTIQLQQFVTFQSPEYVSRYHENEYQEFYKFKEKKSPQVEQNKSQVAGTKIEPFKKYHIRQVNKLSYTQRIHNYQIIHQ